MSKIKNGGLDQYDAGPFEQQQFETAGVEGVKGDEICSPEYEILLIVSILCCVIQLGLGSTPRSIVTFCY